MKYFVTLVVVVSVVSGAWGDSDDEILQRKAPWLKVPQPEVVDSDEFCWQVAVIGDDNFFCAGSLVSQKWVLTAAHCTRDFQVFDLAIGSNQDVRLTTRTVIRHPDYESGSQENDLALLELPEEVLLSLSSPLLKSIQVRGAHESACQATYGQSFSSNKICLDTSSSPHVEGVLSLADGGSPILYLDTDGKYTQVGILSSGPGPSTLRPPLIATKLVAVLSWIQKITGLPSTEGE